MKLMFSVLLPLEISKGIQKLPAIERAFISLDNWICHTA